MKRYGNLYKQIYDIDNLKLAHINARKGKTYYKDVIMVDKNEDYYLKEIQYLLINKQFKTSEYEIFTIWDKTKEREIYKLPYYPDRIVQWAIMQVVSPILLKNLTIDTFSAIPNRGIHFGLNRVKKALKDRENTKYCLKFDIKHFYPSINHSVMKNKYRRIFKDNDLLLLLDEIVDSVEITKDTGLPIGNYLSQWLANFYLSSLDHWLKENKQCKYLFRYMDDVVILAKTKEELHYLLGEIKEQLLNIKLELKGNYQIFPTNIRGIDFLGYRIFANYVLLRKSTYKQYKKKIKNMINKSRLTYSDICTLNSYEGWLKWCDSYRLREKYSNKILRKMGEENT